LDDLHGAELARDERAATDEQGVDQKARGVSMRAPGVRIAFARMAPLHSSRRDGPAADAGRHDQDNGGST